MDDRRIQIYSSEVGGSTRSSGTCTNNGTPHKPSQSKFMMGYAICTTVSTLAFAVLFLRKNECPPESSLGKPPSAFPTTGSSFVPGNKFGKPTFAISSGFVLSTSQPAGPAWKHFQWGHQMGRRRPTTAPPTLFGNIFQKQMSPIGSNFVLSTSQHAGSMWEHFQRDREGLLFVPQSLLWRVEEDRSIKSNLVADCILESKQRPKSE